ncbi:MAG: phosphoglucomutase/phosphomannomutase family protein [Dehalococcoidales bacterium]
MRPIKSSIKFGTDGWRGIIAEDFTFANVRLVARAVADYLEQTGLGKKGLIIGYDTRFASADFARAAAEVIAASGTRVYLCDRPLPTPVISYGVLARKAGGAVIITASHNAPRWNGFKVKTTEGASAPTEVITLIEENIARLAGSPPPESGPQGGAVDYIDLAPPYFKQMESLVDLPALRQAGLKVVIDSMYGAGAGYLRTLLEGGSSRLVEINGQPNPNFPGIERPEPIMPNLAGLSSRVVTETGSVGLATDGDADRIGIIDENGNFLNQLQVYALLALYLLDVRRRRGPIVKTITSTSMLYRLGKLYDVPVIETPVGFKYIAPVMVREKAIIGGEESGGFGFRGHVPERDAILAGLYFLDFMVKTGKTPSQLLEYLYEKVGPHYYNRLDVAFPKDERRGMTRRLEESQPLRINGTAVVKKDTFDGFRFTLADDSWLLIRFSGTEPLLRIYAEASSQTTVERLLQAGKKLVGV